MNEHTSQPLSQRLHDKGFRGEHTHAYGRKFGLYDAATHLTLQSIISMVGYDYRELAPAYTFTELWGVLPNHIPTLGYKHIAYSKAKGGKETYAGYSYGEDEVTTYFSHESPAEALGLLVEWLIDNGHVVKGE